MPLSPSLNAVPIAAGPEPSDRELIVFAQKDARAFGLLYERYLERVYQYCLRRLGTKQLAEDATSQVFLKALSALPTFSNDKGSFRSWLFSIAHNVVIDQYRSAKPCAPEEALLEVPDTQVSPEELAERADDERHLWEAVAKLPVRQRQVIELRIAGLTSAEISEVIGCKPRSVDVVQYRALGQLRTLMGVKPGGRE